MPDSKPTMTFDEIVAAWEVCNHPIDYDFDKWCVGCPFEHDEVRCKSLNGETLKLLKHLGQENEELKKKLWNGAYYI